MSEIICERCGGTVEGKNYFTYCSYRKGFVHVRCEKACENYSADRLPNGTHCRKKYSEELYEYRILSHRISAPEYEVQDAISKYENMKYGELYEKFKTKVQMYKIFAKDDAEKDEKYRVELAAMQQVLVKRLLANPKLNLWARGFFNEVGETKNDKK